MTQTGVVARLALRELWISFRLFAVIVGFVAAGAIVALVPEPLPQLMERLALGFGVASLVAAVVAAWSIADERRLGRAGWLVSRSVPRRTLFLGWFLAVSGVALAALVPATMIGWLAATNVTLGLEAGGYLARMLAVAGTAMAAVAIGSVAGTLLGPRVAALVTVAVLLWLATIAWVGPVDSSVVPGGAFGELAALREPGSGTASGLRGAGVALATTAVVLIIGLAAIERADL